MKEKKIALLILFAFSCFCAGAQTWSEWFSQKKTQKKYLIQQIAALQVYIGYIKKGFSIAHDGLQLAHQIKRGEFSLHDGFFTSLKNVNPKVAQFARISEVVANQVYILSSYKHIYAQARRCGQFSTQEIELFYESFAGLLKQATATLDDLILVISKGKIEMTDDERLQRIEKLYAASHAQRMAMDKMEQDIRTMALQRVREAADISLMDKLYQLP